jgi:hypothetical protein
MPGLLKRFAIQVAASIVIYSLEAAETKVERGGEAWNSKMNAQIDDN